MSGSVTGLLIPATPGISENSAMPGTSENSTTPGASADSMVAFRTVAEPDFPHVRLPLKWEPITKWGQSRCLPLVTRTRVLGDGLDQLIPHQGPGLRGRLGVCLAPIL